MGGAVCLLLSGAAALFYELIWSHQFSVVFGSSEIATASVLGVYLAGLGLGAGLAVRRCRASRRPLATYALLEAIIALSALAVPWALGWAQQFFHRALATEALPSASFGGSWLGQLALTAFLLATPTLCLGASFPYAVRGLVLDDQGAGRTTAWLYSANTLGAVTGSLAVGIVVLPAVGIKVSTWAGAALSLTAAGLALVLARRSAPLEPASPQREVPPNGSFPFVPVVVIAGAVSLGAQILWTRILIHFVGSGLYSLSILLAAYLLGLALGSAVAGSVGSRPSRNAIGFAVAQVFVAGWSWAAFAMLDRWAADRPAVMEFGDRLWLGAAIAAVTMLPIAMGSGAAFLFAINARAQGADAAAPTVARAYKLTAVGNLAGGIVLSLLVFTHLGFAGSQALLVGLSLLAALIAAWATRARKLFVPAVGALALALVFLPLPRVHRLLAFNPLSGSSDPGEIVFAELGTSSSVVLARQEGEWSLRTNGLSEGSIQPFGVSPSRYLVTRWLGLLPILARPEAQDVLVIGLGAGTTVESIPSSVDRVAVVEIERQVVEANRSLATRRRIDPLSDPRVELVYNDARDVLHRSRRSFDVVISQPSHPWTSGAANLYTREFFAAVRGRLRDGGVLAQWLGLPFVDAELLRSVLATLAEVFPYVEVYRPPTGAALIFLASEQPLAPRLVEPLRSEGVAVGIARPEDLAASWVLSSSGVRRAARGAELVTDDRNLLASRSPRILGRGLARSMAREVLAQHQPLVADLGGLNRLALVPRIADPYAAERVASAEPDPALRQLALSLVGGRGDLRSRQQLLSSALAVAPQDEVVRAAALRLARTSVASGGPAPAALGELTAVESLIVAGWRAVAAGEWTRVRDLEGPLAAIEPRSALFWEGLLMRAQWRARSPQREDALAALALLDSHLSHQPTATALTLYALTADGAGLVAGSLAALSDLSRLPVQWRSPAIDAAARQLLARRDYPPELASWAQALAPRFAP